MKSLIIIAVLLMPVLAEAKCPKGQHFDGAWGCSPDKPKNHPLLEKMTAVAQYSQSKPAAF